MSLLTSHSSVVFPTSQHTIPKFTMTFSNYRTTPWTITLILEILVIICGTDWSWKAESQQDDTLDNTQEIETNPGHSQNLLRTFGSGLLVQPS